METLLLEIINQIRAHKGLTEEQLAKIIRAHNKGLQNDGRHHAKKRLLPFYLKLKETNPAHWESWGVTPEIEKQLFRTLQVKPRRTASGVATISVITKPWKCSGECLYCPNDIRMPKSYLSDEPACQRAERNYFDPYLQVASRLRALTQMGHATDKIELIILGGSWSDYPPAYQIWFVTELFRALNDCAGTATEEDANTTSLAEERYRFYQEKGLSNEPEELAEITANFQQEINKGTLTYNQAFESFYQENPAWQNVAAMQMATWEDLEQQQRTNETAKHRMVGLVVETRPDAISAKSLTLLRRLGCTKVQVGIQSIDAAILEANNRQTKLDNIRNAFALLRVFGFKIHTHFMLNLFGGSPEKDASDYRNFVSAASYLPDEVKLYPCVLVEGTQLCSHFADGSWQPYSEESLVELLTTAIKDTPPYVRVSRMVRDISAHDIIAGNKKANLRQLVENKIETEGGNIAEIRYREISTSETDLDNLNLETLPYETTASHEYFLQWVTPQNQIAGFLRLSLPKQEFVSAHLPSLPIALDEAMIREVHIYGKVTRLHESGESAQHFGLGRQLIEEACSIAKQQGYAQMNVISSVGTRHYYRSLGFADNGLYQQRTLNSL